MQPLSAIIGSILIGTAKNVAVKKLGHHQDPILDAPINIQVLSPF